MLFANLCAGAAGNQPKTAADLGNALPLRRGFTLVWSGWDPAAPAATGLSLDAPVATDNGRPIVQRIREEFVAGTRRGDMAAFPLSYEAANHDAQLTVRRTQTDQRRPVAFEFADARSVRLLPDGTRPEPGAIYELHYNATNPRVLGIGFAATRDIISHLRHHGADLLGFAPTHALAFGISQAGRYLRDHIAQGFNADEDGARVFDGVFTHVAGIGRVFHNTPFGQPFRTRTWHEDHDFPEVAFPFSAASVVDPVTGASGSLLRGDASDPKLIETNTSTEYWQKGASLLHTDPLGGSDLALPDTVRGYLLAGTQHGGKAGMPRDNGPCANPRNWHDPMPAVRALLVALDEWVAEGRTPPDSRLPRIADGTLVPADQVAFPRVPGLEPPRAANDASPLADWVDPQAPARTWRPWCRRWTRTATNAPASGCRTSPCRAAASWAGTCIARPIPPANWPTATAPSWRSPGHGPSASRPATLARRWRSATPPPRTVRPGGCVRDPAARRPPVAGGGRGALPDGGSDNPA